MKTQVAKREKKLVTRVSRFAAVAALFWFLYGEANAQQAPPMLGVTWAQATDKSPNVLTARLPIVNLPVSNADMTDHGGKIMPTADVTAIFWGTSWANYGGDKIWGLDRWYYGFSGSNYSQVSDEYTGSNGQVGPITQYAGHVIDTSAAGDGNDTNAILGEVCKVIKNPDPSGNGYYPVYVDKPRGSAGFCGYHSYGSCQGTSVQFAFFFDLDGDGGCDPGDNSGLHSQGLAALANVSGHELSETRTDPDLNAWYDSAGQENGDKCAWTFGAPLVTFADGTQWKLQGEWSNNAFNNGTGYPNVSGQIGCVSGSTPGRTSAAIDANGFLEILAIGDDRTLWHNSQSYWGGWSGWSSLGESLDGVPAIGNNIDGSLQVFARGTDNALYTIAQTLNPIGGSSWSSWSSLAGTITSNPEVDRNLGTLFGLGSLEVFARGADNSVDTFWGFGWTSWGGPITGDPIVSHNTDGRLEVFVTGPDNEVWHKWQTSPGGGWSYWESLGGVAPSRLAVYQNADGRLELFTRGTDNALYHNSQTSAGGVFWSGWESLGGVITSDPVVNRNLDGRLEVFARGTDNGVYHNWQVSPGGGWSGWASLGGVITSDIDVAHNKDGRLEIFASGTDKALYHNWQISPGGGWSGWVSLGRY